MTDQELAERGIDRKIAEVAAREAEDAEVWISGFPHFKAVMNVTLQRHLARVLPLVMLLLATTLAFAFRSPRGVLVPLATIAVSLLWTLGAIVAAGAALNVITVIIPPLVLTLGFAYTDARSLRLLRRCCVRGPRGCIAPLGRWFARPFAK